MLNIWWKREGHFIRKVSDILTVDYRILLTHIMSTIDNTMNWYLQLRLSSKNLPQCPTWAESCKRWGLGALANQKTERGLGAYCDSWFSNQFCVVDMVSEFATFYRWQSWAKLTFKDHGGDLSQRGSCTLFHAFSVYFFPYPSILWLSGNKWQLIQVCFLDPVSVVVSE